MVAPHIIDALRNAPAAHKSANPGAPVIYQPYFSEAQKGELSPACRPLDASFNTANGTREYELFQHLMKRHQTSGFPAGRFWGLVSSKLSLKAPISVETFVTEAGGAQSAGYDCYVLNPMIGNAAIYANVWEQGVHCGHKGMDRVAVFLMEQGYRTNVVEGQDTFAFCNYVCGNAKFWTAYFAFVSAALSLLDAEAEKGTDVGKAYSGGAGYTRDASATMRPFVIERLLSTFLFSARLAGQIKIHAYKPNRRDFEFKFGNRMGSVLFGLHELKEQAVESKDRAHFDTWHAGRAKILENNPLPVWQLDDPPSWMPVAV